MSAQGRRIAADLESHKHCFDFTVGTLAEDVAEAAALGIYIRMEYQVDSSGAAWAPLEFGYADMKAKLYPGRKMAELELHMMTIEQLTGSLAVYPEGMDQTYGIDDQAQDEAQWFQDPVGDQQPPREFYSLGDPALKHVDEVLDKRFVDVVK